MPSRTQSQGAIARAAARDAQARADEAEWRNPVGAAPELVHFEGDEEPPEQSPSERVAALLSDVSEDDERAVVKVLRRNEAGRYEFCDDYTPADFEAGGLAMIRRQWGPGDFRICLYGYKPGTRTYCIRRREQITLARSAPGAEPPPSLTRATLGLHAPHPSDPPAWLPLLLERLAPLHQASAADPLAHFKDMLGMFTMMREAMGITPQQRTPMAEVIEAARELREAAQEFGPGGKPEPEADPMLGMVEKIVELVRASMGQQPAQVPAVALPAPLELPAAAPAAAGEATPPDTPAQPSGEAAVGIAVLVGYLRSLFVLAAQGKPVEAGVDLVVEKLPDDFIDLLRGDAWWQLLSESFPEAVPHRMWLTQVREASLAEFAQLQAEAEAEAAAGATRKA